MKLRNLFLTEPSLKVKTRVNFHRNPHIVEAQWAVSRGNSRKHIVSDVALVIQNVDENDGKSKINLSLI